MTNKEKGEIQKNIVDTLDAAPHGRLLLAPRVGKTKLAIDIIKKNKPKSILWVTPSSELADVEIPKEFEIWKAKAYAKKLTTTTWASLNKIKGKFDMIILDEEQFITDNNSINLINGELEYNSILTLTGTQTKNEGKINLYKALKLPILYELSINDAVDLGILSNYVIKVVKVPIGKTKDIKAGNKANPFYTSEESQYNWYSKSLGEAIENGASSTLIFQKVLGRMRAIHNSPSKATAVKFLMEELSGRKMAFCANIKQAEQVCSNFYHSKSNKDAVKAFIAEELDSLSLVNAGGVGWTYRNIDHLIIAQADSDNNGTTSQKIARTLLEQKNYKATIWIIALEGTQDVTWVKSVLDNFDPGKVEYIEYKNLLLKDGVTLKKFKW